MSISFTGPQEVDVYRAVVIAQALKMYAKHKIKVNRAYTPTAMLRTAGNITGNTYKRGQYMQAHDDLKAWVEAQK